MIHLADLRHSYRPPAGSADASSTVLDFASWQVAEGEQVALMGGSGSGKTTLLNLVAGLLLPDAGRVKVAGIELTGLGEARRDRFRAEHVGYVFQSFHLLDGFTARENVELGSVFARGAEAHGRAGRERATALLEAVGLGARMDHLPRQLSVGQQARVSLARALMNRPQVILADEPTGSLDAATAEQVLALLQDTAREEGITLVCATHDAAVAAAFPRTDRVEELK